MPIDKTLWMVFSIDVHPQKEIWVTKLMERGEIESSFCKQFQTLRVLQNFYELLCNIVHKRGP